MRGRRAAFNPGDDDMMDGEPEAPAEDEVVAEDVAGEDDQAPDAATAADVND